MLFSCDVELSRSRRIPRRVYVDWNVLRRIFRRGRIHINGPSKCQQAREDKRHKYIFTREERTSQSRERRKKFCKSNSFDGTIFVKDIEDAVYRFERLFEMKGTSGCRGKDRWKRFLRANNNFHERRRNVPPVISSGWCHLDKRREENEKEKVTRKGKKKVVPTLELITRTKLPPAARPSLLKRRWTRVGVSNEGNLDVRQAVIPSPGQPVNFLSVTDAFPPKGRPKASVRLVARI